MFTTKYSKNQPKKLVRVKKFQDGGKVELTDDEKYSVERDNERKAAFRRAGIPTNTSLPVVVRTKGKFDPYATGQLSAKNDDDQMKEAFNDPRAARNRAKKKDD